MAGCHRLGSLSDKYLFLSVLESGSPRLGCQHGWVIDEDPLPTYSLTWPSLVGAHTELAMSYLFFS